MERSVGKAEGTTLATEMVWEEFHGRLLAFIRHRVPNGDDAEDILQDVFARVHANLHRLTDAQSLTAWVYRIARHAIADHFRARAKATEAMAELRKDVTAGEPLTNQPGRGVERRADARAEFASCLEPLLSQLPESYRQALRMTELGVLTQQEAAQRLGLSISGMKSRVQRGRKKLKDSLLQCCTVELDRRRGIVDFAPRNPGTCGDCGCE